MTRNPTTNRFHRTKENLCIAILNVKLITSQSSHCPTHYLTPLLYTKPERENQLPKTKRKSLIEDLVTLEQELGEVGTKTQPSIKKKNSYTKKKQFKNETNRTDDPIQTQPADQNKPKLLELIQKPGTRRAKKLFY